MVLDGGRKVLPVVPDWIFERMLLAQGRESGLPGSGALREPFGDLIGFDL